MKTRASCTRPLPSIVLPLALVTALVAGCSSDDDDGTTEDDPIESGGPGGQTDPGAGSMPSPTIDRVPVAVESVSLGTVLGSRDDSLTLYTRPADEPGTVTCAKACAETFPPLLTDVDLAGISGDYDIIDNPGSDLNQWTYKGYPLHLYSGDAAAGETSGQGIDDAWYVARPDPITSGDSAELGEILVVRGSTVTAVGNPTTRNAFDGRTLYTSSDDESGVSNCIDACIDTWIPLYADLGAVDGMLYSVIDRSDGPRQWAFDGQPLYLYSGDNAAGDITGNGVGGTWSVVTQ